jgi:membrane-associated phospholipid phosphatase
MPRINWAAAAVAGAAVTLGQLHRRLGLPRGVSTAIAAVAPLSTAAAVSPGRLRRGLVWGTQMWAYKTAFEAQHDDRGTHRARLRVDYPIRVDSALGAGKPPGQRLQESLRRPPRISSIDKAMSGIYALWEVEPHLALLLLLLRRPERFPQAAARLATTYDLTLVGYWGVPTAPPWWASEKLGRMDGSVRRVTLETLRELRGQPRPIRDHETGANPWAAMPSDHFATALMTAANLFELGRLPGALGVAYAVALGFALVYLGEHYVIDLAAGATLAAAVLIAAPRMAPIARRLAAAWPHA